MWIKTILFVAFAILLSECVQGWMLGNPSPYSNYSPFFDAENADDDGILSDYLDDSNDTDLTATDFFGQFNVDDSQPGEDMVSLADEIDDDNGQYDEIFDKAELYMEEINEAIESAKALVLSLQQAEANHQTTAIVPPPLSAGYGDRMNVEEMYDAVTDCLEDTTDKAEEVQEEIEQVLEDFAAESPANGMPRNELLLSFQSLEVAVSGHAKILAVLTKVVDTMRDKRDDNSYKGESATDEEAAFNVNFVDDKKEAYKNDKMEDDTDKFPVDTIVDVIEDDDDKENELTNESDNKKSVMGGSDDDNESKNSKTDEFSDDTETAINSFETDGKESLHTDGFGFPDTSIDESNAALPPNIIKTDQSEDLIPPSAEETMESNNVILNQFIIGQENEEQFYEERKTPLMDNLKLNKLTEGKKSIVAIENNVKNNDYLYATTTSDDLDTPTTRPMAVSEESDDQFGVKDYVTTDYIMQTGFPTTLPDLEEITMKELEIYGFETTAESLNIDYAKLEARNNEKTVESNNSYHAPQLNTNEKEDTRFIDAFTSDLFNSENWSDGFDPSIFSNMEDMAARPDTPLSNEGWEDGNVAGEKIDPEFNPLAFFDELGIDNPFNFGALLTGDNYDNLNSMYGERVDEIENPLAETEVSVSSEDSGTLMNDGEPKEEEDKSVANGENYEREAETEYEKMIDNSLSWDNQATDKEKEIIDSKLLSFPEEEDDFKEDKNEMYPPMDHSFRHRHVITILLACVCFVVVVILLLIVGMIVTKTRKAPCRRRCHHVPYTVMEEGDDYVCKNQPLPKHVEAKKIYNIEV